MVAWQYRCSECGKTYRRDEVRYVCPACAPVYRPGEPLHGVLTVEFDADAIRGTFRKRSPDWALFLAIESSHLPAYPVGNTPFFPAPALGRTLGLDRLWLKHDGLNPSGSLKDRASHLVVAEANRLGLDTVVVASTGNAAAALAAVCAAAGKQALILVPATAPQAKLAQMLVSGARVIPIRGTYDDAFALSLAYTARCGGLNRNTAYHPLTIEGKKTVGLEIWSQNRWAVPDVIVVPVGDGVIISGVHKAFADLKAAGLIARLPRLVCAQAESSASIHHFIQSGAWAPAAAPDTVADSISVSVPSAAHLARTAVLASGGTSVTVSDAGILTAQRRLASTTGIWAEPASSAAVAALEPLRATGAIGPRDQVVVLLTGHGLKDVPATLRRVTIPPAVEPTLDAVMARVAAGGAAQAGQTP